MVIGPFNLTQGHRFWLWQLVISNQDIYRTRPIQYIALYKKLLKTNNEVSIDKVHVTSLSSPAMTTKSPCCKSGYVCNVKQNRRSVYSSEQE